MPTHLEVQQDHQRDEVSDVQGRRRRVNTSINRAFSLFQVLRELVWSALVCSKTATATGVNCNAPGHICYETTSGQVIQQFYLAVICRCRCRQSPKWY